jgi:ubiquinone/menaquinone biosynthesis C-methylase UbiE
MLGFEHSKNNRLSAFEQCYISLFGYPALGLHVRATAVLRILKKLAAPRRILDAGCGRGILTFEMAKIFRNAVIVGVDKRQCVIDENTAIANACGLKNCIFITSDLLKLADKEKYDCILSTDNMEHMEDDDKLLELFYALITPGGNLILHVPHMQRNIFGWKRTNFMGIEGHVRPGYYLDDLVDKIKKIGFDISETFYSYNSFETIFNDISCLITGGREKKKCLYAVVFPFLLLVTKIFRFWPTGVGSGIVVHARKML